ncbi:MAG: S41 family peptidase [Chloroflexota bacterium]|nr:S41 family peptidase [Chloroflexota bacterium]
MSLFAILVLLPVAGPLNANVTPAEAQNASRTFPETGKTVKGRFLEYWNRNGGLAQQGFPISEEMQEKSPTDGKTCTVQYFERAVFEWHPENPKPNDVLLSLLGVFQYEGKYGAAGAPGQKASTAPGAQKFTETGKTVGGKFLEYWKSHGGLAQQGFPISEEFTEVSQLNGKPYTVQYFQRAVFELHPENPPPHDVLLSQLGRYQFEKRGNADLTVPLDTFQRVWTTVRDRYVYTDFRGLNWQAVHDEYEAKIKASGDPARAYRLISEMVVKLGDHHSRFIDPARRKEDEAVRRGEISRVGIGASSQDYGQVRRISYVVPGGPADRAGIKLFDLLLAVNGTRLDQDYEAIKEISGPAGSSVTLTVQTPGEQPRDVTVVRQEVEYNDHATSMRWPGTNVVYLNIPTFGVRGMGAEVRQELQEMAASGPIEGVVIDVRVNDGGSTGELSDTLALFLNGGIGGYSTSRNGRTPDTIPSGQTLLALEGKPVIVLTSGLCESACETFAAALKDLKRATVLGTNTAGNTETTYPHDFPDGSRLFIVEQTFTRIDGSSIEDVGLAPDIVMDVPWHKSPLEQDPQVKRALELLQRKP